MQVADPVLHRQVRMQVITSWTGGHADALRHALRMTNESFAEYLGVAARQCHVDEWFRGLSRVGGGG